MKRAIFFVSCWILFASQSFSENGTSGQTAPVKVTPERPVPDYKIRQKVQNLLHTGHSTRRFGEVNYSVDLGYVHLTGYVDTETDKNDVEAKISSLDGVKGVQNELKVREKKSKFENPAPPY